MDRIIRELINAGYSGEWDRPVDGWDLGAIAALVLRIARDDFVMAWQDGRVRHVADAERWLNDRIRSLGVGPTTTGDTTEVRDEH